MISPYEILKIIPSFAFMMLLIHMPLLFALHKYTRIKDFLKFVHVFFASIIIFTIEILINPGYQAIFFDFLIWYWLIPSIGVGIITGTLYKLFENNFWQNLYSS